MYRNRPIPATSPTAFARVSDPDDLSQTAYYYDVARRVVTWPSRLGKTVEMLALVLAHPPDLTEEGVASPVVAMARAPNPTRSRRAPASASSAAPGAGSGKRKVPEAERPAGDGGGGCAAGGAAGGAAAVAAAAADRGGSGKPNGGTLLLVPQALMCQWKAEVAKHAPSLSCCIINTTQSGEIIPQTDEHPTRGGGGSGGGGGGGGKDDEDEALQAALAERLKTTAEDCHRNPGSGGGVGHDVSDDDDSGDGGAGAQGAGLRSPLPLPPPPPPLPEGSAAWLASFDVVICSHAVLSRLPWHGGAVQAEPS